MVKNGQREAVTDALVLFDATHGTLRLTEPAYARLDILFSRLKRSVEMTPSDGDGVSPEVIASLESWIDHLGKEDASIPKVEESDDSDGWIQVYDVGSIVARRDGQGILHDIEVDGHEFRVFEDKVQLFYLYKTGKPMKAMTAADSVEPVGDEWTMVYLNRETGEKRESLDDGEH